MANARPFRAGEGNTTPRALTPRSASIGNDRALTPRAANIGNEPRAPGGPGTGVGGYPSSSFGRGDAYSNDARQTTPRQLQGRQPEKVGGWQNGFDMGTEEGRYAASRNTDMRQANPVGGASASGREALEREYAELQAEKERGQAALDGLAERIHSLRQEVEAQRRRKPASCASCRAVTLQVDAAAQSLLGSAGHVARTLLRDANADRRELLDTVLRYMEPVKHLDPDLEDLYERAQASLAMGESRPTAGNLPSGSSGSRAVGRSPGPGARGFEAEAGLRTPGRSPGPSYRG